jgi:hypothetical protein
MATSFVNGSIRENIALGLFDVEGWDGEALALGFGVALVIFVGGLAAKPGMTAAAWKVSARAAEAMREARFGIKAAGGPADRCRVADRHHRHGPVGRSGDVLRLRRGCDVRHGG